MPTLMTFGNSEGERRCDEKCYNANHPVCVCCCGGMNHGKGFSKAMANTVEYGKDLLENLKQEHPEQTGRICEIQQQIFIGV